MKHLIAPAFAVVVSTVGCIYGCHAAGMPPHDVMIAGILAFSVSFSAAGAAVALKAGPSPRAHLRQGTQRSR